MIYLLLYLLLLSFGKCQAPVEPSKFHAVGYITLGYNIYEGFPLPFGQEGETVNIPGFLGGGPIFSIQYEEGKITGDGNWEVPDGTVGLEKVQCSLTSKAETIKSAEELNEYLQVKAGIKVEGLLGSFSLNSDYQAMEKQVESRENYWVITDAKCSITTVSIIQGKPPPLNRDFVESVKKNLNDTHQGSKYQEFIRLYGTHFLTSLALGSKFNTITKISKQKYDLQQSQSISVEGEASYNSLAKFSATLNYNQNESSSQQNEQNTEETYISVLGAPPDSKSNNFEVWLADTKEYAEPVGFTLESISKIFTNEYWTSVPDHDLNLTEISAAMEEQLIQYCINMGVDPNTCRPVQVEFSKNFPDWSNPDYEVCSNDVEDAESNSVFKTSITQSDYIRFFIFKNQMWLYTKTMKQSNFYSHNDETNLWNLKFKIQLPGWDDLFIAESTEEAKPLFVLPSDNFIYIVVPSLVNSSSWKEIFAYRLDHKGNITQTDLLFNVTDYPSLDLFSVNAISTNDSILVTAFNNATNQTELLTRYLHFRNFSSKSLVNLEPLPIPVLPNVSDIFEAQINQLYCQRIWRMIFFNATQFTNDIFLVNFCNSNQILSIWRLNHYSQRWDKEREEIVPSTHTNDYSTFYIQVTNRYPYSTLRVTSTSDKLLVLLPSTNCTYDIAFGLNNYQPICNNGLLLVTYLPNKGDFLGPDLLPTENNFTYRGNPQMSRIMSIQSGYSSNFASTSQAPEYTGAYIIGRTYQNGTSGLVLDGEDWYFLPNDDRYNYNFQGQNDEIGTDTYGEYNAFEIAMRSLFFNNQIYVLYRFKSGIKLSTMPLFTSIES